MVMTRTLSSLVVATCIGTVVVGIACSHRPPDDPKAYAAAVTAARAAKDADFQRSSTPVPDAQKTTFLPLAYFPVDPAYNVIAGLVAAESPRTVMMPTSTGQQRRMRDVGMMEFVLKGQPLKLRAMVEDGADMSRLTVMFSDLTSGSETYAAGRYIDLDRTASGIYALDFNRAYHPYCYYNPTYECPYPPADNRLPIPVRAGERLRTSAGSAP